MDVESVNQISFDNIKQNHLYNHLSSKSKNLLSCLEALYQSRDWDKRGVRDLASNINHYDNIIIVTKMRLLIIMPAM